MGARYVCVGAWGELRCEHPLCMTSHAALPPALLRPACHARRSDNGGASFLGEVVAAVKEMVEAGRWQLESVPRLHPAHEVALAEGQGSDLPAVQPPTAAPVELPEDANPAMVRGLWEAGTAGCIRQASARVGLQSVKLGG